MSRSRLVVDRAGSEAFLQLELVSKFDRVRIFTDSILKLSLLLVTVMLTRGLPLPECNLQILDFFERAACGEPADYL